MTPACPRVSFTKSSFQGTKSWNYVLDACLMMYTYFVIYSGLDWFCRFNVSIVLHNYEIMFKMCFYFCPSLIVLTCPCGEVYGLQRIKTDKWPTEKEKQLAYTEWKQRDSYRERKQLAYTEWKQRDSYRERKTVSLHRMKTESYREGKTDYT